jgi:hypothetical protein
VDASVHSPWQHQVRFSHSFTIVVIWTVVNVLTLTTSSKILNLLNWLSGVSMWT